MTKKNNKTKQNKIVYCAFAIDILHEGHINILKAAYKLGDVVMGVLTDKAIAEYKQLPHFNYDQRRLVAKNIKYVKQVIPQNSLDYTENLLKIKPDYVVHGDDWKNGIQKKTRLKVIKTIKKWSGKLIEPKYTQNIKKRGIKDQISELGTSPDTRKSKLKRLLNAKSIVRILECHSALTGLIIENLQVKKKDKVLEFDGLWSSSLTDSLLRGKPDNQSVDYSTRISGLSEILDATSKPIIFDGDNGGRLEHLPFLIKSLERVGASAIILEDKIGLKKNSLFKNQKGVKQDSIKNFCKKLSLAKKTKISNDFMIIARIESFILGKNINDALKRAEQYVKSGANAIMIHSKEKVPDEIFDFGRKFFKSKYYRPIIAVPSSYSKTYEKDLIKNNIKIVIYANHLLRSSYPAMMKTAESILENSRAFESEKSLVSVNEIISLI